MTIREATPADAAGIARAHVESWRTTYPGIMPQEHLDALSVAEREQTWQAHLLEDGPGTAHIFVAVEDNGEIVGFTSGGPERTGDPDYTAEIYTLYLLKSQQGRGLGRQLMTVIARHLRENGHATLMLWTHVRNPARGFYEAMGGVAARTTQRTLKGIVYDDVGYGWNQAAFRQLTEI
jgi:GNAT superfamily N-acetyltransferase